VVLLVVLHIMSFIVLKLFLIKVRLSVDSAFSLSWKVLLRTSSGSRSYLLFVGCVLLATTYS